MIQFIALAAMAILAGCQSEDEENPSTENHENNNGPKNLVPVGEPTITSGNNQTLVAAANGQGCYVVDQTHGDGYTAGAQFTDPSGTDYSKFTIEGSTRGTLGWGTQLEDGRLAFPLQSLTNDNHGVLVTDEQGQELVYHDLAAQNLTGPGGVLSGPQGILYTVTNNGDYVNGGPQFTRDSSLVNFDASNAAPSSYSILPLGITNATGLAQRDGQIVVAGAGDWAYPNTAELSLLDVSHGYPLHTNRVSSLNGMGLNGVMPTQNQHTLLTGFGEAPVALFDGTSVQPLALNNTLQGDWVAGAQFLYSTPDQIGIVLNSHDSNNSTMSVYALLGDPQNNDWQIESSWLFEADSPVGMVEYAPQKYCTATNSAVYYFAAE